ncbi:hypothetical protein DDB_G0286475 [Dictyostelium discoideum AX4]|uniref:Uncharacterized protein n=1 Tax=Dictyostelium discoideum TaxID=44689 RepID=Q54LS1_DICDI|nr:hypothetical protein DDB_G0286475 [Dictyostelium discoideum AX4]EAL64262.1 hypothetical protein DDB_G0286475 [Dictyostelium discoideum AX4]|eukprot:XP_637759.1 hypothetical protein DDB_G0286475 [Dictyostelium discoideum AX4]
MLFKSIISLTNKTSSNKISINGNETSTLTSKNQTCDKNYFKGFFTRPSYEI